MFFGEAVMSTTKYILPLLLCSLLTTCKVVDVPEPYKFNRHEINISPYGNWVELILKSETDDTSQTVAGELLALEQDSIYLLVSNGNVCNISRGLVVSAALCTHRSRAGNYFIITMLFSAPAYIGALVHSEYAGNFAGLGYPVTLNGLYHVMKEGIARANFLIYPRRNGLSQFQRFARFPAGLPENIEFSSLHLKQISFIKQNALPAQQIN